MPQPSSASEFTTSTPASRPDVVTAGPDGNVWFTEDIGKVGRVTPNGVITEFPLTNAAAFPVGIVTGPDGNIWFAEKSANKVARMTTAGVITEFQIPTAAAAPDKITVGADGNLWFTEHGAHQVARLTIALASNAPANTVATDSTYTGVGYLNLTTRNGVVRMDNFGGGTLP